VLAKVIFHLTPFEVKSIFVLLSFRPLAWTAVCHDQMKSFEEKYLRFDEVNTVALGIGADSVPSNKAWAESMEIKNTRIFSDFWPHGEVAKAFGVFRDKDGVSERANILIDAEQNVVFAQVYSSSQLPDVEPIIDLLKS